MSLSTGDATKIRQPRHNQLAFVARDVLMVCALMGSDCFCHIILMPRDSPFLPTELAMSYLQKASRKLLIKSMRLKESTNRSHSPGSGDLAAGKNTVPKQRVFFYRCAAISPSRAPSTPSTAMPSHWIESTGPGRLRSRFLRIRRLARGRVSRIRCNRRHC